MVRLTVLLLITALPLPALAQPPAEVLEALDRALLLLDDPGQVMTYRVSSSGGYAKLNGNDAHEFLNVSRVTVRASGEHDIEILQNELDGETIDPKGGGDEEEGGTKMELKAPAGEDLDQYVYGEPVPVGGLMTATFEPAPGVAHEEGLGIGRLVWNPATLQPVAIEFVPSKNPRFVESLTNRLEFGSTGDLLHMRRLETQGVGGIPGFKRSFTLDLRIDEVVPAP